MNLVRTRKCVGVIIYYKDKIFLMRSPKWSKWIIPGGGIEDGESEEDTLRREIREEMNIEVSNIVKLGEKIKEPSNDFRDNSLRIHFIDFMAEGKSDKIIPNEEISEYGWFTVEEALKMDLLDTLPEMIRIYDKKRNNTVKDKNVQ